MELGTVQDNRLKCIQNIYFLRLIRDLYRYFQGQKQHYSLFAFRVNSNCLRHHECFSRLPWRPWRLSSVQLTECSQQQYTQTIGYHIYRHLFNESSIHFRCADADIHNLKSSQLNQSEQDYCWLRPLGTWGRQDNKLKCSQKPQFYMDY